MNKMGSFVMTEAERLQLDKLQSELTAVDAASDWLKEQTGDTERLGQLLKGERARLEALKREAIAPLRARARQLFPTAKKLAVFPAGREVTIYE